VCEKPLRESLAEIGPLMEKKLGAVKLFKKEEPNKSDATVAECPGYLLLGYNY